MPQPHWRAALEARPALEQLIDELAPAFGADETHARRATLQSAVALRVSRLRGDAAARPKRWSGPCPASTSASAASCARRLAAASGRTCASSSGLEARARRTADLAAAGRGERARAPRDFAERRDPGARWRVRERERLHGLLHQWLELETRSRSPSQSSAWKQGSEIARHAGLDFSVRIDRVDRLADGARILIDYKTRHRRTPIGAASGPTIRSCRSMRCCIREHLVAVAYGRVNAAECGFVAESERGGIFQAKRREQARRHAELRRR